MASYVKCIFVTYLMEYVEIWKRYGYISLCLGLLFDKVYGINRLISGIIDTKDTWSALYLVLILMFILFGMLKFMAKIPEDERLYRNYKTHTLVSVNSIERYCDISSFMNPYDMEMKEKCYVDKNSCLSLEKMVIDFCPHTAFRIPITYCVYPVFNMSRLASYSPVFSVERPISFIQLSEAGFHYLGHENIIVCECCKKRNFLWRVVTSPSNAIYHNHGCQYIIHETPPENMHVGVNSALGSSNTVTSTSVPGNVSNIISAERSMTSDLRSPEIPSKKKPMLDEVNSGASAASGPVKSPKQSQAHNDLDVISDNNISPNIDLVRATASPITLNEEPQAGATVYNPPLCESYITVWSRLESFDQDWIFSNDMDPIYLAEAGFFYAGHGDCVKCFQCGLSFRWKLGDDVYNEHERLGSNCSFLQLQLSRINNPPAQTVSGNTQDNASHYGSAASANIHNEEPQYTTTGYISPFHGSFISIQSRLDSFQNWRFSNVMNPIHLAEAGFFYTGTEDCVRCFQCDLGLKSWRLGDDVYTEHERFRPSCPLLQSQLSRRNNTSEQTVSGNTNQDNELHILEREVRRNSFANWSGPQYLDPEVLSIFYYFTGPGYSMKCINCRCVIYVNGDEENLEELAQELQQGRPICCLCAYRLCLLTSLPITDEEWTP